jgi:hypothetical protein
MGDVVTGAAVGDGVFLTRSVIASDPMPSA